MIQEALKTLFAGRPLPAHLAVGAMDAMMTGQASDAQSAAYLTALRLRGEEPDVIAASAKTLRKHAKVFDASFPVMEIVGTGGDGSGSFNISTTSALVVAAAGVPVAKHGNGAASSACGSADVLKHLGATLDLSVDSSRKILNDTGFCFLFAPTYHRAMRHVAHVRRQMGERTLFNLLGPLANPAGAQRMVLGVYSAHLLEPIAEVLRSLGVERALVVHGDGLDEISPAGTTVCYELYEGRIITYPLTPESLGLPRCEKSDLKGGDPAHNARLLVDVLSGKEGPKKDAVLMNAGAALYIAGAALSIADGVDLARRTIDSGKALATLEAFLDASRRAVSA